MEVCAHIEPVELQHLRRHDRVTWGILGGMGPIASSDLVRKIYQRASDGRREQLMPSLVMHSDCSTPDRTAAVLNDAPGVLVDHLAGSACALERAGADVIVIACVTAHWVLPALRHRVGLPILSLIDLLHCAPELHAERHLVVATHGSRKANLFAHLPATAILPDEDNQARLHDAIYVLKSTGDRQRLVDAVQHGMDRHRCTAVLAGCTEVGLIRPQLPPDIGILDPMDLVSDAIWDVSNLHHHEAA